MSLFSQPSEKSQPVALDKPQKVLQDLLQLARNLPKLHHDNLGLINLTVNELQHKTELLRRDKATTYNKAHYLLSSSGINAGEIEHELEHLPKNKAEVQRRWLPEQPASVENYLIAKKEENILNSIEQSLAAASRDFDSFINKNVTIDWRLRRDHLRKSLGIVPGKVSKEELAKSFSWNKLQGPYRYLAPLATKAASSRHLSRDEFESYAKVVYQLNEARLEDKPFPICLAFEELSKSNTDLKLRQVAEVWRLLARLCNEKFARISQQQTFAQAYALGATGLRRDVLLNSRRFLEEQFFNYVDEIYTKGENKPVEFAAGNNVCKVLYFIHQVVARNDAQFMERTLNVNGVPIWALLYYLLRSGLCTEAVELILANKGAFDKFDTNLPIYLSKFVKAQGLGLPSELQERVAADFNRNFQFMTETSNSFDPYKYAVYKIIGKCDLAKKLLPAAINLSIEDWLWFHLLLVNEFNPEAASNILYENYTLAALQKKVMALGADSLNASPNNPMYLKTLVMLGLYEQAVKYTYEVSSECDAVHMAIGLSYYGLLHVLSAAGDTFAVADKGRLEINLGRLLGSYTRTFKISDPKVAAQYLVLICLPRTPSLDARCHEALRELILISREFSLLLGDVALGDKVPGMLEKQRLLINLEDLGKFHHQIVEVSAGRCEEEGRIFDALLLYQLCQEYDTVVGLINKFLGEILAVAELEKPLLAQGGDAEQTVDNNVILFSRHTMEQIHGNSYAMERVSSRQQEINNYLMPIIDIREHFVAKNWLLVLQLVQKHGLVPVVEHDDFAAIRRAADSLNSYDDTLVKVVPLLLIMVMTSISHLFHTLMTRRYGVAEREKAEVARLKSIAKNCMVYAGMIQYKMPRETYSLLINLESEL